MPKTLAQVARLRVRDRSGRFAATRSTVVTGGRRKKNSLRIPESDRVYRAERRGFLKDSRTSEPYRSQVTKWVDRTGGGWVSRGTPSLWKPKGRKVSLGELQGIADQVLKGRPKPKLRGNRGSRNLANRATVPSGFIKVGQRVDPFAGKPEAGKADPSFKVQKRKGYQFQVPTKDGDVRLNNNETVFKYQGETFLGVPTSFRVLRDKKTETLVNQLVDHVSQAVDSQKPMAIQWQPKAHGTIDKKYLYKGKYGTVQLHHVDQHLAPSAVKAMRDWEAGKLGKQAALAEVAKSLKSVDRRPGYEIVLAPKAERSYVCLPGNAHDVKAPLYRELHPKVLRPDTGELFSPGIPKEGPGSRQDFNASIKPGFWREYHRRESFVISGELSRRMREGTLDPQDLERLIETSRAKREKNLVDMLGEPGLP